jgi:serine phosphatase RsbU (regulator of sigma subunit)
MTYARAGHLPPLLVAADRSRRLDGSAGPPLGALPGIQRVDEEVALGGDELILLFSDGLVERRGEVIDVGLDRLAKVAQAAYGSSVQEIADLLLVELLADGAEDDVVLVVKQLSPA